jgi:hypothetical protein
VKAIKTRITNLSTRIEKIFPEKEELLQFPGINRELILDSLAQSYKTIQLIDDLPETFEVVLLKRKLALLFDSANKYLKEKYEDESAEEFNEFLNTLASIHYSAQETYILLSKQPIRIDDDLSKAKKDYSELTESIATLQPLLTELQKKYNEKKSLIDDLVKQYEKSLEDTKTIAEFSNKIASVKKSADKSLGSIHLIEETINIQKNDLITKNETGTSLLQKLKLALDAVEDLKQQTATLVNGLQGNITKNDNFQLEIQKTIEDSSRMGMAASFKRRKDELRTPYWIWSMSTVATIILLIMTSYQVFVNLNARSFDLNYLLLRLPILAAFVWLGWFCARNFGFTSRIREDYSYKYAVSMAFEGYKKESREIDQDLLKELIQLTIHNISTNPLSIYETQSNHGTPANELLHFFKKKSSASTNGNEISINENKTEENPQ